MIKGKVVTNPSINYSVLVTLCYLLMLKKKLRRSLSLSYYYLDHSRVFVVSSLPCTFFPVHMRGKLRRPCISTLAFLPSLSLLAFRTLDTRLSLKARRSLGPSLSRTAPASFGSVTSITARYPRGSRHAMHPRNTICPWLSAITLWKRLW